jgi:guanylate kinase
MLIILCGKSGSGKDAVLNELCNEFNFNRIISCTTRPMREREENHKDYHFMSNKEFLNKIKNDDFIEYRAYTTLVNGQPNTWYYGMPKITLDKDKDYTAIVDLNGARDLINYYGGQNCFVAYIVCPDWLREQRAKSRGSFDNKEWNRRLKDDNIKFSSSKLTEIVKLVPILNYGIIDNMNTTVEQTANSIVECLNRCCQNLERD